MEDEDFGAVPYLGVTRWWSQHPVFHIFLAQGLPAYATDLLDGTETPAQLAKPWMICAKRKDNGLVVANGFFNTEAAAMTALKNEVQTRLGISAAKVARIIGGPDLTGPGSISAKIRRWRKIDPDADDT